MTAGNGPINTTSTVGRQTVDFLARALQEEQEQRRQKERILEQLLAEESVIRYCIELSSHATNMISQAARVKTEINLGRLQHKVEELDSKLASKNRKGRR